jgi:hypothetical protein
MSKHVKLTANKLNTMRRPKAMVIHWDTLTPGMGIRCHPTGKKMAMVMFRVRGHKDAKDGGAKSRVLDIGRWYNDGDEALLKDFRTRARKLLEDARNGIDPKKQVQAEVRVQVATQERAQADTINTLIDRYLKAKCELRSIKRMEREFDRFIRPKLGKLDIGAVGAAQDRARLPEAALPPRRAADPRPSCR